MDQATIVGGAILAAFVLYLAMNQRFAAYYAVLMGSPTTGGTSTTPATPNYLIPPVPFLGFPGVTG